MDKVDLEVIDRLFCGSENISIVASFMQKQNIYYASRSILKSVNVTNKLFATTLPIEHRKCLNT
jgi:hypothetical protein